MTLQPALFTDPRVPGLERALADAHQSITRLEAELDRMADLLDMRTAWLGEAEAMCGCPCARRSGPGGAGA